MAGFDMFDDMISAIQEDTVRLLYHVQAVSYTHLDVYKRQGIYCPKTGAKILYDCMKRKGMTEGLWLFRIAP